MTYKEIINRIRTVAQSHLMIKDFGYGELSDIKTQAQLGPSGNIDDGKEADYPYMFLLQSNATRNDPVVNYNFSMIMMDMARGEEGDTYDNYLTIQSQCQQYIDDVLANLYYFYRDQPMVQLTGITYQPFKEKYQDEVAGMTCNFTIEVPNGLNDCIAPFGDLVEWWSEDLQYSGGGLFLPDGLGNTSPFEDTNGNGFVIANTPQFLDAIPNWRPDSGAPYNAGEFIAAKTYSKIELTFDMTYTWEAAPFQQPSDPATNMDPYWFWYSPFPVLQPPPNENFNFNNSVGIFPSDVGQTYPDTVTGWPDPYVTTPVVGTTYPVTMTWNNVSVLPEGKLRRGQMISNYPGQGTPNLWATAQFSMQNLNLKLYA